jgi:hypothetical protein
MAAHPEDRALSVRDLAAKVGVGKSTVSRVNQEKKMARRVDEEKGSPPCEWYAYKLFDPDFLNQIDAMFPRRPLWQRLLFPPYRALAWQELIRRITKHE